MRRLNRWTRVVATALAALILVPGMVGCGAPPAVVPSADSAESHSIARVTPPTAASLPTSATRATEAVRTLLAHRAAALAAGDAAQWAEGVADPASPAGKVQLAAFDALRGLGVREVAFSALRERETPEPAVTGVSAESAHWSGTVQLAYRIPGVDRDDRVVSRTLLAVAQGDQWRIVSWLGPTDTPEVFDLPEVQVRRAGHVLVVVSSAAAPVALVSDAAERAWQRVATVADGIPDVVVVVPPTASVTAAMIGRSSPAGLEVVGATTVGERSAGRQAGADRVVLGPDAAGRLTAEGRVVVLAHEFAHVAMRSTTRAELPMWLAEGLAEHLAYRASGLDTRVVAAAAIARAQTSEWPTRLPVAGDFDTAGREFGTAYQVSWLAVRELAQRRGDSAMWEVIRELGGSVDSPAPADPTAALSAWLRRQGTSESDLVSVVRFVLRSWGSEHPGTGLTAAASR